jgi:hypothetical protein
VGADQLPEGEYAIVECFGHTTLVGRISEVERFGAKMLALEPLFNGHLLPVLFQGGASIYRLTPCTPAVAWARQPKRVYLLPPNLAATLPPTALPSGQLPLDIEAVEIGGEDRDGDSDWNDRDEY